MIVQEINLYQDRFKEKKLWLSAAQQLMLIGSMIVILAISSYWYDTQHQIAEQQQNVLLMKKQQSTQALETQRKKLQGLLANNHIDNEISKISTDIAVRKRIIKFVSINQFGSGKGFSSYLSGLSDINVKNLWLNEISLTDDYVKLTGSSLKAEKIPEYFKQFQQHQLFNGKQFEVFQINREQEQNWKVDFLIASRAVLSDE